MRIAMFKMFFVLLTIAVLSTPALADRTKGTVKWFNAEKGYDFIEMADGDSIFVHASAISGSCNGTLREGQAVEFDIDVVNKLQLGLQSENGQPKRYLPVTRFRCLRAVERDEQRSVQAAGKSWVLSGGSFPSPRASDACAIEGKPSVA